MTKKELDKKKHKDCIMGPVIDEITKKCKDGGLDVVRAPGVMQDRYRARTNPAQRAADELEAFLEAARK